MLKAVITKWNRAKGSGSILVDGCSYHIDGGSFKPSIKTDNRNLQGRVIRVKTKGATSIMRGDKPVNVLYIQQCKLLPVGTPMD